MRTAIYCRISKDAEQRGLGVQRQEHECRDLVKRRRWKVAEVYTDNDLRASRVRGQTKQRPDYERLLADVRAGKVDAVVAWDFDRLFRDPMQQEQFFQVCESAGVQRVVTIGDDVDVRGGDGMMIARIKGAVAAEEVRKLSGRLQSKHAELARAGNWKGGVRPYGYEPTGDGGMRVVPKEKKVIQDAAKRVLAGEALYSICVDLNERQVPTVKGFGWRTPVLRRILTGPMVAGQREYKGEVVGPGKWKAILDEATWLEVRNKLRRPGRAGRPPVNLLAGGLAQCACGSPLYGQTRTNGRRAYYCPVTWNPDKPGGCGQLWTDAQWIEEYVRDHVLTHLAAPQVGAAGSQPEAISDQRLRTLEARLDELTDMFAAGDIDRRALLRGREGLEGQIEAERRRLAGAARRQAKVSLPNDPDALLTEWNKWPLAKKRAAVQDWLARVVITPPEKRRTPLTPDLVQLVPREDLVSAALFDDETGAEDVRFVDERTARRAARQLPR